jgi:ubiquinol-cytochrome c reductase cytochrome b subunit
MSRAALALFTVSFIALGYLGMQPAEGLYVVLARIFAVIYFLFFILMPFYTWLEPVKPVPERVTYHAH